MDNKSCLMPLDFQIIVYETLRVPEKLPCISELYKMI